MRSTEPAHPTCHRMRTRHTNEDGRHNIHKTGCVRGREAMKLELLEGTLSGMFRGSIASQPESRTLVDDDESEKRERTLGECMDGMYISHKRR